MEPGIWGFTCWSHTPPAIKLANCGLGGPRWGLGLGCCWVGRGGVQLETEGCFPHNFACCIWSKPINYWDTRIDIISSKSMCRDQQPMIRIRSFFVSLFSLFHSAPPPLVEGFWLCVFFYHLKNWGGSQLWYHCPDFHHGFAGLCGVRALGGFSPNMEIFPREIPLDRMLSGNLGAGSLVFNLAGLPSEHGLLKC